MHLYLFLGLLQLKSQCKPVQYLNFIRLSVFNTVELLQYSYIIKRYVQYQIYTNLKKFDHRCQLN